MSDADVEFIFEACVCTLLVRLSLVRSPLTVANNCCRLDQDSSGRIQYSEFIAAAMARVRVTKLG